MEPDCNTLILKQLALPFDVGATQPGPPSQPMATHITQARQTLAYFRAYHAAHREQKNRSRRARYWADGGGKARADGRAYYRAHAEEAKRKTRERYWQKPEELKARHRAWRERNREYLRAYRQRYCDEHREAIRSYGRERYWRDVDTTRAYHQAYRQKHRDRLREGERRRWPTYRLRLQLQALQMLGRRAVPTCRACGEMDLRVLTANHTTGGGTRERKRWSGHKFYQAILTGKRSMADLEVLCHNCNARYEYEAGRRRLPENWRDILAAEVARFSEQVLS